MRDDIIALLRSLAEVQRQKLDLLDKIYRSEINKHHLLKSGLTDDLLKAIEYDSDVIERIQIIDVDAAQAVDAVCRILEIVFTDFEKKVLSQEGDECAELRKLNAEIKKKTEELYRERNALIRKMEQSAGRLADDIKTLSRLRETAIEKKGDSGSA